MPRNNKRLRAILDHVLIGLVIIFGTSTVSAMAKVETEKPGLTLIEKVMHLVPCSK
jgi:hypothetical protein